MRSFLRTLAFPIACAFTGAATALLVAAVVVEPAPACVETRTIHVEHQISHAPPAPAFAPPAPVFAPPAPPVHVVLSPPAPPTLEIPEGTVRCIEPGRCVLDRGFYLLVRDNPALLAGQAHVMPHRRDGKPRGLKFYGVRPGSLPGMLGLKNGDLLTAVNGIPTADGHEFATADTLLNYLAVREHPVLTLEIERKGQPVRVNIDIAWQQEQALKGRP